MNHRNIFEPQYSQPSPFLSTRWIRSVFGYFCRKFSLMEECVREIGEGKFIQMKLNQLILKLIECSSLSRRSFTTIQFELNAYTVALLRHHLRIHKSVKEIDYPSLSLSLSACMNEYRPEKTGFKAFAHR